MSGDERVYSPDLGDSTDLNVLWPLAGDVHAHHLQAQERGEVTYLIAQARDGTLQGSVVIGWNGFEDDGARKAFPDCVEIRHLFVRDAHRGRGVATRLVMAAETKIRAHGAALAGMGVADDNDAARKLYERLGYESTGVFDVNTYAYFDDDGIRHDATERNETMIKRLSSASPDAPRR